MSVNTKGSLWRIWDLQVQTILDDRYVELSKYYEDIKRNDPHNWSTFISKLGGEEYALLFDSKKYILDPSLDQEVKYVNYARVLFAYIEVFRPLLEAPIKLTTSGQGKLTTCFAGEDLVIQSCQG